MIISYIKKFKEPTEENDKKMLEIYNSLSEKNKIKVDKRATIVKNCYLFIGIFLLITFLGVGIFTLVSGGAIVSVFMLILCLYPIFLIKNSLSWNKAKNYQRIPLARNDVIFLLKRQEQESQKNK